ncbi:hypothetical protein E3O25_02990 [Cryobacterium sp. TMT1-3]|uniref:hypothetical protein n=1 Tax=Cryobacterium sp. TMT1-3 TaxID=1259237 RepID=UPI00106B6692|nr:hypothetical protein [Cryobacterium sp. TMT1-3]TFC30658.1 hypothetical protein E3O25_02990 [Cryobacterium sp. TMT1-3]
MSSEALGGGVMVAVAAVLWVAYLMPTWSRRKQYQATERNAVRLQQTLRILAETAEVPQQVRLEATARTVAEQQRVLARVEQDARAEAQAVADAATSVRRAAAAVAAAAAPRVPESPMTKLRRLRRFRGLVSLILLAGFVLVVAGIAPALAGSFTALVGGGVVMVAAFGILGRLATVARSARIVRVDAPVELPVLMGQPFEPVHLEATPVAPATWTPQPVPRALHLSRGSIAQTAMASVEAANQLRKAAAEAEVARRAAALAEDANRAVTPIARPAAAAAAPNRFASMGIVGETSPGMTDLDAVLRRRRAV